MAVAIDPDRVDHDPDGQAPLPFPAAVDYARTVMAWSQALDTRTMQVVRDVAYGPHRLQRYDVFRPARPQGPVPVLVFWHGGGWTNGYRNYVHFLAPHVTALGWALVAPSYRLAPEHRLPAAFNDALSALQHIVAQAPSWGADPTQLVLGGHSAGGHLATLVALRPGDCRRMGVPPEAIRACMPISAILDLHHPAPGVGSLEERVYSMVLDEPASDRPMSPLHWAQQRDPTRTIHLPPLWLTHGDGDSERVIRSNRQVWDALKAQGAAVSLTVLPGHDHFQTHTALIDGNHPWYRLLTAQVLAPANPAPPG